MSEIFLLTSGEMHEERSERRKKTCCTQATFVEAVPQIDLLLSFVKYSSGNGPQQDENCGPDSHCKCKKSCGQDRKITCIIPNGDCGGGVKSVCCCRSYCRMLSETNHILTLIFND